MDASSEVQETTEDLGMLSASMPLGANGLGGSDHHVRELLKRQEYVLLP
jgi:hypothetical protein